MTTTSIRVSKLVHSPRNGRQPADYPPDSDYHRTADLEEQILHFGLIHPPTAHPMAKGLFGVFIGGRRLLACQRLIARGALPKDHAIDVAIRDEPDAVMTDMSFAENASRVALTAVTEFRTFAQLIDEGADVAAIARRYAVTELHVRQRMRLGQLHPDVLDALAAERISLDIAKAYAATADQELQKRVFDQRPTHAFEIRAALKRDAVNAGVDRMIELVTIDAYSAAGGRAEEDLFVADETRLLDVDILKRLYDEKLAAAVAALRLPPDVTLQFGVDGVGRAVEIVDDPTDEQRARVGEIERRCIEIEVALERIAEWDGDGVTAKFVAIAGENADEVANLVAEKDRLLDEMQAITSSYGWPDGPLIAVAKITAGELNVVGFHRPYGWAAAPGGQSSLAPRPAPAVDGAVPATIRRVADVWESDRQTNGTVVQPEAVAREDHGLSKDAAEVMRSCRRQALSAIMLRDIASQRIAQDYMTFVLARGMIGAESAAELGVRSVPLHEYDPPIAREDLAGQPAAQDIADARERVLGYDWMREVELHKALALFVDAPEIEKTQASAYVAVLMLSRSMNAPGYRFGPLHDQLASMLGATPDAIREQWTPDERYFKWLPKARRLEAIGDAVGPTIAGRFAQYGNEGLAQAAALVMAAAPATASRHGMMTADIWRARAWIPEYMAFSDPDNPARLIGQQDDADPAVAAATAQPEEQAGNPDDTDGSDDHWRLLDPKEAVDLAHPFWMWLALSKLDSGCAWGADPHRVKNWLLTGPGAAFCTTAPGHMAINDAGRAEMARLETARHRALAILERESAAVETVADAHVPPPSEPGPVAGLSRAKFMVELRADVSKLMAERPQITPTMVERELPDRWRDQMPSRLTIANAITGLGWTKQQRPGSGAVYIRPANAEGIAA